MHSNINRYNITSNKKMSKQENEMVDDQNTENEEQQVEAEINAEESVDEEKKELTPEEELQEKFDDLNNKYLRLYSEFENFRKRTGKEKADLILSGGEDAYKSLLPIIDDFDRGMKLNAEATDIEAVNEGVKLIYDKFKSVLTQKGLKEQEALGEVFDADLHEALTNIPSPDEESKGKILDVMEKGYTLNGKVIRFAKVVVGN